VNNRGLSIIFVILFATATAVVFWEWRQYVRYKQGLDYSEIMDYAFTNGWGATVLLESWIIFSILGG